MSLFDGPMAFGLLAREDNQRETRLGFSVLKREGQNRMIRRELIAAGLTGVALSSIPGSAKTRIVGNNTAPTSPLPRRDRVDVAFLISDHANVIDIAGPWEVFQDSVDLASGRPLFNLFSVAASKAELKLTGGLSVNPAQDFSTAPPPHVVVVPAQRGNEAGLDWLRRVSATTDLVMSVCTGAFHLAAAGLLDGLAATTHHDFEDRFAQRFPSVRLQRGVRFVDNGRIATSAGLSAGIDLALHVVARYFGAETASATARYMEYDVSGDT
jgi:transcriptional regulator GlxA family with amidase domain